MHADRIRLPRPVEGKSPPPAAREEIAAARKPTIGSGFGQPGVFDQTAGQVESSSGVGKTYEVAVPRAIDVMVDMPDRFGRNPARKWRKLRLFARAGDRKAGHST